MRGWNFLCVGRALTQVADLVLSDHWMNWKSWDGLLGLKFDLWYKKKQRSYWKFWTNKTKSLTRWYDDRALWKLIINGIWLSMMDFLDFCAAASGELLGLVTIFVDSIDPYQYPIWWQQSQSAQRKLFV